ncbi:MAG: hypothetical protein ACRETA_07275 [Gammaproteobacteria bacterium]
MAKRVAWVRTVDRQRIAQRLAAQSPMTLPPEDPTMQRIASVRLRERFDILNNLLGYDLDILYRGSSVILRRSYWKASLWYR